MVNVGRHTIHDVATEQLRLMEEILHQLKG